MDAVIIKSIAGQLGVRTAQVETVLKMLEEGDTVPFIARYRKEATGALDEEQILTIEKTYKYELNLAERKEAVLNLIETQGKLTEELKQQINACTKLSQVEDLYKPYKQKKKTRAAIAIKNGLQPLADLLLSLPAAIDIDKEAEKYLNEDVKTIEDAIQGAKDIIAENISDNAQLRWKFKELIEQTASIQTKLKKDAEDEKKIYEMYYDYTEKVKEIADHRIMAIDRAEKEKVISVGMDYDTDYIKDLAHRHYLSDRQSDAEQIVTDALDDGIDRLLLPSIENEIRSDLSKRAQDSSIEVFSLNLEKLLSQAPLKGRVVLGFDPGYYNGCKLAVVDETGKMLEVAKIYPFRKNGDIERSKEILLKLIRKHQVRIVAIGNGTASRESEKLVSELIKENGLDVEYAIVSEAGASVWSAQEEARKEFPDLQVEERSAVSIGRRLLDPLAELIKIDPKAIGVGQYQHDLPEKALNERLDEAIMKVVNRVGADVNTASTELLEHISGLNKASASEIVNYRNSNGKFSNRKQLLKVKKIGEKAYEQCAGFLRIIDGEEPLDATNIHPESYELAKAIMKASAIEHLGDPEIRFNDEKIAELSVDPYTLQDIKDCIRMPLRDYRDQFDGAILKSDVLELSDLKVGDELSGTVRNVVDFGAFVDIGLHDDGLVHISHMAKQRISHPSEVVSVGDIVKVYVYGIDEEKHRVQLSLLSPAELAEREVQRKDRSLKKAKNRPYHQKKEETKKEEPINEDEAMKRLLERFGSRYN